MKQSDFYGIESPKTESFSGGEFCLVVQTLHSGGGNHSFGPELIENEAPASLPLSPIACDGGGPI